MNLVQSAMRRPLTILVAVIAVALGSVLALRQMPRDIFPTLGIPTIYVAQPFGGMDAAQMEGYLTYYDEYHFLYITGIEHVESKSIQGASLIKLQFYPGTDMSQAMSETVAYVNRARAFMPPGTVPPNSVVRDIRELEHVPIRTGKYPAIFLRDVGEVVDGSDIVTSYALVNGRRTVYVPVTKRADASTLSVVNLVKTNIPRFQAVVPPDVKVSYEFDQSPYVTRAIAGLTMEGGLGALLTGVMILLFLRDWRTALVVVVNIPLSLMGAVLALWITKQTVNIMSLGGLALAIGILVDMSTVVIENMHTHLGRRKAVGRSVVDSGQEVALPLLIAMLCVLAVFVPSFFMVGAAKAMFLPLSLSVGFSMVASYFLSSTLVPILSVWVLRGHKEALEKVVEEERKIETGFAKFQKHYAGFAQRVVRLRWLVVGAYLAVAAVMIVFIGRQL